MPYDKRGQWRGRRAKRRKDRILNIKRVRARGGSKRRPFLSKKEKTLATRFGQYLKGLRLAKGVTQAALARAAGVSPAYIWEIENATRTPPSARVVSALLKALDPGPLDEMDLRIASGRYTYCPQCGHGFLPTDETQKPKGWDKEMEDAGRKPHKQAPDLGVVGNLEVPDNGDA